MSRLHRIQRGKQESVEGPDWAAHRFRLRSLRDKDLVEWSDLPWYYLGPRDPFVHPKNEESEALLAYGFEVYWEGRSDVHADWEFVDIEVRPARLSYSRN